MSKNIDIDLGRIKRGNPRVMGVTKLQEGYNFAVSIPEQKPASLLLYKVGETEPIHEISLPQKERVGTISAVVLLDFDPEKYDYNYKIDECVTQDPHAVSMIGKEEFGVRTDLENPHKIRCRFVEDDFLWDSNEIQSQRLSEMILYKLHVRGFTMQKNSGIRAKGTFQGVEQKIPYLKELGITAVELMPCYEFEEIIIPSGMPASYVYKSGLPLRINYWGYTDSAFYFAPKASYCASDQTVREVKEMVKALHAQGIECIMEFYFPKEMNPLMSLEILRYWKTEYHMDGFHLVGEGVAKNLLMRDPLLSMTKLFFQNVEEDLVNTKKLPLFKNLAEYNEGFKQDMRRFLKGDEEMMSLFAFCSRRNPSTHGVINYMSMQDGFTMMDMVSYELKHNEDNGEGNADGTTYNYSWNCGVEGPSRKMNIRSLRIQQIRNSYLLLLLSQGTPLLYQGDECGNSQNGNNNAYCQDNQTGWLNWQDAKKNENLMLFVKHCIAFRKEHPVLHMDIEPQVMDYKSLGCPDLSYHSNRAWFAQFDNNIHHMGVMYNGDYAQKEDGEADESIYIAYNMHWTPHEFALPNLSAKHKWFVEIDTGLKEENGFYQKGKEPVVKDQRMIRVLPRTIVVLVGK